MDMQAAFDKAYLGVFRQGGPSLNEEKHCAYTSVQPDGSIRHCGIGWLKDASWFTERDLEGKKVCSFALQLMDGPDQRKETFLSDLQNCHDDAFYETNGRPDMFMATFTSHTARVAHRYNLDTHIINLPSQKAA